jgi:hypothetical protein
VLTVASVLRSGGIYNVKHVELLEAMVSRHLPAIGRFVCLSDLEIDIPNVDRMPLAHGWPGYYSKLELFRPIFPEGERILYFDLDTVITGSLSTIAARKEPFIALGDFYRRPPREPKIRLASGVMMWTASELIDVYKAFARNPNVEMKQAGFWGDQAVIERYAPGPVFWQDIVPEHIVSFKCHCQQGLPDGARVVAYHGQPKPWSTDSPAWVEKYYTLEESV